MVVYVNARRCFCSRSAAGFLLKVEFGLASFELAIAGLDAEIRASPSF